MVSVMGTILEIIKERRSQRVFQKEQISEKELELILEAGRYAPTGGNLQTVHFIVIRNAEILTEITRLVEEEFRKMELREDLYISVQNGIKKARSGSYEFFYEAPVLIVVANKTENQNGMADSACATENMMLQATELGVGNCWINQLRWLNDNKIIHKYLEKLGLGVDETVCASLALGYPKTSEKRQAPKRTGMRVTYVD